MLESMQALFQFGFSECFSCLAFWRFRFGAVLIIYSSAKFWRRIPIDVANRFFCSVIPLVHCRDWWAWIFTKCCLAVLGTACYRQLGWFSDVSDGAIILLWFLEFSSEDWIRWKAGNYPMCWGISLVILSCLWCRRTPLDSLCKMTCLYCLPVNPASYMSWLVMMSHATRAIQVTSHDDSDASESVTWTVTVTADSKSVIGVMMMIGLGSGTGRGR